MKKIIPILFLFAFTSANAANMCVRDDVMMVVLDPQIGGTELSSEVTGKTWSTSFSYGVISGIGACYTGGCTTIGCVNTNQNLNQYMVGMRCYCKMLHPVSSAWVYGNYYSGGGESYANNNCANNCASSCSSYAGSSAALRKGLFGSIGN